MVVAMGDEYLGLVQWRGIWFSLQKILKTGLRSPMVICVIAGRIGASGDVDLQCMVISSLTLETLPRPILPQQVSASLEGLLVHTVDFDKRWYSAPRPIIRTLLRLFSSIFTINFALEQFTQLFAWL